jgi:hypothetical protein
LAPDNSRTNPPNSFPSEANPFLAGYDSEWRRAPSGPRGYESAPPPATIHVEPPRTPWLTLLLSVLGVCAASATTLMLHNQHEAMERQIALIEQQNKNFEDANRVAIDLNRGMDKIKEGNALVAEANALVRANQNAMAPTARTSTAPVAQSLTAPSIAPPAAVVGISRDEFQKANARTTSDLRALRESVDQLRGLQQRLDDLRASFPQSGSVQETAMRRYQIKLTGAWSEAERRELKWRWAEACAINVDAIAKVPGGYEFQSRGCAAGTFDDLKR